MKPILLYFRDVVAYIFFYSGLFRLYRFVNSMMGRRLTILTYHRITDKKIENIKSSLPFLFIHKDTFHKQLDFIKRNFNIIDFNDLDRYLQGNNLPHNSLIITFDDGYEDFYKYGYPILRKLNLSGSIFLTSNKIGNNKSRPFWWDRAYYYFNELKRLEQQDLLPELDSEITSLYHEYKFNTPALFRKLNKQRTDDIENLLDVIRASCRMNDDIVERDNKMLTWEQISEMKEFIEIGSHSCEHLNLVELDEEKMIYEVQQSKKRIEEVLGKAVTVFSYPVGAMNETVKNVVMKSGYKFAVTTESGLNHLNDRPYKLKRINIWEKTSNAANGRFSKSIFSYHLLRI